METFQIKRVTGRRMRTDYIVLVPSICFIEKKYPISPVVYNSGGTYTWGIWEKYFLKDLKRRMLPCHFFLERINEDYTATVGSPYFTRSYFIDELVQTSIIDHRYLHSIVIMLGFNFNLYPTDRRLCTQLSYKLINPLLRQYDLNPTRVKFIDECFNDNWQDSLKDSKLDYELCESELFDINILIEYIHKYNEYNRN